MDSKELKKYREEIKKGQFSSDFVHSLMCKAIDSLQTEIKKRMHLEINEKISLELNREYHELRERLIEIDKELLDEQQRIKEV